MFGYVPGKFRGLKNLYLRMFGYPDLHRRVETRILLTWVREIPSTLTLDAGCGEGFISLELAKKGYRMISIDVDEEVLKQLRWSIERLNLRDRIEIVRGDVQHLPFKKGAFGLIVCNCVLEHVKDDEKALREFYMVTQPGGRVMITVDSIIKKHVIGRGLYKLPRRIRDSVGTKWIRGTRNFEEALRKFRIECKILRGYAKERFIKRLEHAGFRVVDVKYYLKLFGAFYWDLIFSVKLFAYGSKYHPCTPLGFPILYLFTFLDDFLPRVIGNGVATLVVKKGNLP
jgi:ubiquinone/menaquinone biosynthesis C-methylase UbiE